MYLFARSRSIAPARMRAAVGVAVEAASRVREMTGLTIWVWSPVLSQQITSVAWTTRVEHLSELEAADAKIMASTEFGDWVEQNDALFTGPLDDAVTQVLYGTPSDEPGAYVQVVRAICANGSVAEAMGFGAEIAEASSRITGLSTMFGAGLTGSYGGVVWITGASDLAAVETANAALAANDDWAKLVDRAGHAFQPGVTGSLLRRLN
jgi:hypothetical protein